MNKLKDLNRGRRKALFTMRISPMELESMDEIKTRFNLPLAVIIRKLVNSLRRSKLTKIPDSF